MTTGLVVNLRTQGKKSAEGQSRATWPLACVTCGGARTMPTRVAHIHAQSSASLDTAQWIACPLQLLASLSDTQERKQDFPPTRKGDLLSYICEQNKATSTLMALGAGADESRDQ